MCWARCPWSTVGPGGVLAKAQQGRRAGWLRTLCVQRGGAAPRRSAFAKHARCARHARQGRCTCGHHLQPNTFPEAGWQRPAGGLQPVACTACAADSALCCTPCVPGMLREPHPLTLLTSLTVTAGPATRGQGSSMAGSSSSRQHVYAACHQAAQPRPSGSGERSSVCSFA